MIEELSKRKTRLDIAYIILSNGIEMGIGTKTDMIRPIGKHATKNKTINSTFNLLVEKGMIVEKRKKQRGTIYEITKNGKEMKERIEEIKRCTI
jgi:predicted transcriptional regulator